MIDEKISACLIVKDEEAQIAKAIGDLKEVCDEIIVVDTGSTDKTVEIVKQLGADVYHFKWNNHFGKARNFSFSKAKYNWIFYIDADERLSKSLKMNIKKLVNSGDFIFTFPVIEELLPKSKPSFPGPVRLFKKSYFRYKEDELKKNENNNQVRLAVTQTYDCKKKIINTFFPIIHCQRYNSIIFDPSKVLRRADINVINLKKEHPAYKYIYFAFIGFFQNFYRLLYKQQHYKNGLIGWKHSFLRATFYFLIPFLVAFKPDQDLMQKLSNDEKLEKILNEN